MKKASYPLLMVAALFFGFCGAGCNPSYFVATNAEYPGAVPSIYQSGGIQLVQKTSSSGSLVQGALNPSQDLCIYAKLNGQSSRRLTVYDPGISAYRNVATTQGNTIFGIIKNNGYIEIKPDADLSNVAMSWKDSSNDSNAPILCLNFQDISTDNNYTTGTIFQIKVLNKKNGNNLFNISDTSSPMKEPKYFYVRQGAGETTQPEIVDANFVCGGDTVPRLFQPSVTFDKEMGAIYAGIVLPGDEEGNGLQLHPLVNTEGDNSTSDYQYKFKLLDGDELDASTQYIFVVGQANTSGAFPPDMSLSQDLSGNTIFCDSGDCGSGFEGPDDLSTILGLSGSSYTNAIYQCFTTGTRESD